MMREKIIEQFGSKMLRRSALNFTDAEEIFERVLKGKGYRVILEIGTYRGCTAAVLAQYCDQVITIDLAHGKLEANGDVFDRRAFWRELGVDDKILFIPVEHDAEKARVVSTMSFDLAFVDGAHDASVANDFAITKRCGNVLFHDADDNRKRERKPNAPNHVYEFISSLPQEEVVYMDLFALWQAQNPNITVPEFLRKK